MDTMLQQAPPRPTSSHAENSSPVTTPNQLLSAVAPAACSSGKHGTPDRLEVPSPFIYSERHTSPTDQMMSPVTRGILGRGRKGSKLLPPYSNHHKIQPLKLQEGRNPFLTSKWLKSYANSVSFK